MTKPHRCEWCHKSTPTEFLHYLGRARSWVCYQCFQGEPYNERLVLSALRRLSETQPGGVRLGDIMDAVKFPPGSRLLVLLERREVERVEGNVGKWLPTASAGPTDLLPCAPDPAPFTPEIGPMTPRSEENIGKNSQYDLVVPAMGTVFTDEDIDAAHRVFTRIEGRARHSRR